MNDLNAPPYVIREAIERALAEDLSPLGDITSSLLPPEVIATGEFIARSEGVIAGTACVAETFAQIDASIEIEWNVDDGVEVGVGDVLGTVHGSLGLILSGERTARNFLCHLSGIATKTRRYVRAGQNKTRIRDTRFTTPGLRTLEKAAVRAGGGVNHRGSLSDGILLRDKHLSALSFSDAVRRARLRWPGRFIQVECRTFDHVVDVLDGRPDMIMLDAMSADEAKKIVALVAGTCPIEVFGAIDIRTVGQYVSAGVDYLSITNLTQSITPLEVSFDVQMSD